MVIEDTSTEWDIPGGGGPGCPLGFWIFCFMVGRDGPKSNIEPIGQAVTKPSNKREIKDKMG